jgi:hypothetical protein
MGEDRLAVLSRARPWALSDEALVAGFDALHALTVEAQAALVRFTVEIDARKAASKASASSTGVWYRNRHRVGIRSAHRLVRLAKRIEAAPAVVAEGVAVGAVNLDQADVLTRAVARIPAEVGVDVRERAAAELVRLCAELDADLLRLVGERILSVVAPEMADELDRRAMEREEAQARRERYFTLTPDGAGVRLSGRLTPEGAAVVRAAIDPLCAPVTGDERTPEQRRADALVDVCELALATTDLPENGGDRPRSWSASTSTPSPANWVRARWTTVTGSPRRRPGGWPATPASSRSCSAAPANRWMWVGAGAPCPGRCAGRWWPGIGCVPSRAAIARLAGAPPTT